MKRKTPKKSDTRKGIRQKTTPAITPNKRRSHTEITPAGETLEVQLTRFFEYHPPGRLSRNLRRMMMEFLMTDQGIEAFYLKDLLYDLDGLFDVLDNAATDYSPTSESGSH